VRTLKRLRRAVAAGLVAVYLPSCTSWKLGYLDPAEMSHDAVQVTTIDGKEMALVKPWVRGDSLVAGRRNKWGTADRDTIAMALADIRTIRRGGYTGTPESGGTIPDLIARAHPARVRVTTAAGTSEMTRPWVVGDSLLGYGAGTTPGAGDTVRVALPAIRRLEVRADDMAKTLVLIGVSALVVTGVVVAARCGPLGCGQTSLPVW
jgi:hypothetical protein